jgi:hypothetical protein
VVSDDDTVIADHPMNTLYKLIEGPFSDVYGWQLNFPNEIPNALRRTGFVGVEERHNPLPLGRWHSDPKMREVGIFCQNLIEEWADAMLARPDVLGLTAEEGVELAQSIGDALNNPRIHARLDWLDVWGQKPHVHTEE